MKKKVPNNMDIWKEAHRHIDVAIKELDKAEICFKRVIAGSKEITVCDCVDHSSLVDICQQLLARCVI